MKQKPSRYYEIFDGRLYVYDQPYRAQSISLSIVPVSDLRYYHNNFNLQRVWG